jgi:probable HAF family extracellular repeat protein
MPRRFLAGGVLILLLLGSRVSADPVLLGPNGDSLIPDSVMFAASPNGSGGFAFSVIPGMSYVADINDLGEIVGDTLFSGGTYTTIEYGADAINNDGLIVGTYVRGGPHHAFTYEAGTLTTFLVPGSTESAAYGVNSQGQIVGAFVQPDPTFRFATLAFVNTDGAFTAFRVPGSQVTYFSDINDHGQIVGNFVDGAGFDHPFLYENGVMAAIDVPYGISASVQGINNAGQIVGNYIEMDGDGGLTAHAYLYDGSTFTRIEFPEVPDRILDVRTSVTGINNHGQIVGRAEFLRVPEPSTLLLFGCGLVGSVLCRRRIPVGSLQPPSMH